MAHLPPSSVFGALPQTDAVHVLFLIENSLPMVEHLYTLQRQLLPSVLGAIRLANPGTDVQVYWETTGKTQEQMMSQQKPQRHFDDFPHIDIVGLPRNRLSPLFIRQSVELFLYGNGARESTTQHVVLVAMSDPIDNPLVMDDASSSSSRLPSSSEDAKWSFIADSMFENRIVLHLIANPTAKLARLFELYRRTMRAQSRQEVIPWQITGEVQCKCHLSGKAPPANASPTSTTVHEWPEVISETFDPSTMLRRPNKRGHSYPPTAPRSLPADDGLVAYDSSVPLSPTASLVTRMQAIHGLAKRRPERPRAGPSSFFRDEPPKARDRGPSANRERLRNVHPIDTGQGAMAAAGPSFGRAQSPTSLYGYTDALLASTSSLASPLGGPQQTLYQMPSPGSDASSSSSSKSPLWPQQNFEYPLREDMAVGYGPQASSSLSPQLNTLSSANSSNGARSLGTSSLTDTGLIASYPSSSFNFPSSWLGPPPVSVGGYTTSVPYGVPTSSSSSTGSRQSPQMLPHYPTGGMPPPSAFSSAQPMTGRAAEKARQQQYNPYRKSMATTNTPRLPPVSNALATQFASASAGSAGSSGAGTRSLSMPTVPEAARTLVNGDAPFLFDPVAEAQNSIRLQQAIRTLDNQNHHQGLATSPTQATEYSALAYLPANANSSYPLGSQDYDQFSNETIVQGMSYPY